MDLVHCSYALMYTLHTHALTRTHILTHTLHTCCSCKGCFLGFLMREFFSTVFCWRKTRRFSASCSGANFCWGRRSMSQGLQKHFSFGQAKYSTGIYVFMWRLWSSWLWWHNACKPHPFKGSGLRYLSMEWLDNRLVISHLLSSCYPELCVH